MRTLLINIYRSLRSMLARVGMAVLNAFPPGVREIVHDVPYHREDEKQVLDILIPNGDPPFPVLVFIHGGGFQSKDKQEYTYMVRSLAHRGFVVFNINYRLAPTYAFPCALQDVSRAIRWVHSNAERHGGDPRRIFLAGDSAGAYLAGMYAASIRSQELMSSLSMEVGIPPEHVKGLLLFYGFYDVETVMQTEPDVQDFCLSYFGSAPQVFQETARLASPSRHVTGGFPPALLISGEKDGLHPESVAFDRVLTEEGVPHKALFFSRERYPLALHSHGFATFPFLKCARIAMKEAYAFLDELR